ncbi:MAG: PDZ domain-containing protein [Acidimicrobiia bacterium]
MNSAEEPPPPPPPRRGRTILAVALSVIGVLIAVVLIAGFLIHLPYVIISSGFATPLDDKVITVDGAQTYDHRGNVLFLTVRVTTHDPTVWRVVTSWFDPDREVVKRTTVIGCLSDAENIAVNAQLMQRSQDDAKNLALTHLGYTVEASAPEFIVAEVCPGSPAYGTLRAGDSLLAIDDHAVTQLADVRPLVQQHRPGEPTSVTYSRGGTTETAKVVTGRIAKEGRACVTAPRSTKGSACLGLTMDPEPFVTYRFPIDVTIDTQKVGGPSAGLAFTLAIIDDLTPGNLTGGMRVAVTGTIASNGAIGPVGGVEQKAITARHNGVSLMIVPKSELMDARNGAGNVRVIGVDTIDEALAALQRAGGAPVPPASPVAARS